MKKLLGWLLATILFGLLIWVSCMSLGGLGKALMAIGIAIVFTFLIALAVYLILDD